MHSEFDQRNTSIFWVTTKVKNTKQARPKGENEHRSRWDISRSQWILKMDPYISFSAMCELIPHLATWGKEHMRDTQLRDHEDATAILPIWLKGAGGRGKSRFIKWFAQTILDLRVFNTLRLTTSNGGITMCQKWSFTSKKWTKSVKCSPVD